MWGWLRGPSAGENIGRDTVSSPSFRASLAKEVRPLLMEIAEEKTAQRASPEWRFFRERCTECGRPGDPIGDPENPDDYRCDAHMPAGQMTEGTE